MKLHDLFETTTSGSIAPVSAPLGGTQKRAGSLFKGKKTKKPFVKEGHYSKETPFEQGYDSAAWAAADGTGDLNPFDDGSPEYIEWNEGYQSYQHEYMDLDETRRMSPGEKLGRAFDREKAKSARIQDAAKRERDAIMARWEAEKQAAAKKEPEVIEGKEPSAKAVMRKMAGSGIKNAPTNIHIELQHAGFDVNTATQSDVISALNQSIERWKTAMTTGPDAKDPAMQRVGKEYVQHYQQILARINSPVVENEDDDQITAKVQAHYQAQIEKNNAIPIDEAKLSEEEIAENDVVLAPGKGSKFRSDIISKKKTGPLAKFSPPFKATGLWISDRRGNRVSECETAEIAAEVAKMLNTPVDEEVDEATTLMRGASPEARQRDIDQSDNEYIIQRQQKEAAKRYKYSHDVEIEPDGENAKMWHYIEDAQTGKKYEPDWSPYSEMTPDDVRFYMHLALHGGEPTREEAQSNGPLRSEDLMKIMKNRQSGQHNVAEAPTTGKKPTPYRPWSEPILKSDAQKRAMNPAAWKKAYGEGTDDYYKPRYDFTGSQKDVPPSLGTFDRKKTISVDGASYGYVPKMGRIWIYQSGACLGWVEPKKNPITPNDLRELIRKYLPTIPKDYLKKFGGDSQVQEEIIMDWDKFPDKQTAKGWENLKALTQAADYQTDADIELGDDLVTLENKEVHLVLGLYREAVYAKRHEEMLRVLSSPFKFHKMIKKLGAGQHPKFTDVVETPMFEGKWYNNPAITSKYKKIMERASKAKNEIV